MSYHTIQVRFQGPVCFIRFYRPEARNTINGLLVKECHQVLDECGPDTKIVVWEGLPEVFCDGVDFQEIHAEMASGQSSENNPELLYDLWLRMVEGPMVNVAHVRGKANAGGIGFVAACDIVLADSTAQFGLSELLFGLFPACVLPFLIRRTGYQKAHYLTLMTRPISVDQAHAWGLVDAYEAESGSLLRKHLLRLQCLSAQGILRYKRYITGLDLSLHSAKAGAVAANKEVFADPHNREAIYRYIEKGIFPWEE
ncbi:enoyl-CoA hydratase/isomerase [Paenibacillus sp. HJL G12]|uniref:Enoyl-CoA hydratase/isomerase n=1 Tax=Paenibacillus dendrobii TaxID=2691084 RepID=A0A7X3INK4_9BACL|nr:enoyl-CoA hydratase/isomerase [Paenibacillus dendrobii]MWV45362.1 enoyl-CoA hydratase/isomerase [Paenibacillus dendrobii]